LSFFEENINKIEDNGKDVDDVKQEKKNFSRYISFFPSFLHTLIANSTSR
jgi:hypothetical protein